ncbi:hypothetical protein [Hymenobacter busanensis]|uniref:hypothetical protein n=1 Tax=Hymenobacter busanensis TaxID=2607656 RepID=UPI001367830C|nr:hypothetical protein [Hymenobacter busanensis]QHJ07888.1 hypothetical protein GUY19_11595 [Hymenobacter busanensis]
MSYTRPVPATVTDALQSLHTYNFSRGIHKEVKLADGTVAVFVRGCVSEPWREKSGRA